MPLNPLTPAKPRLYLLLLLPLLPIIPVLLIIQLATAGSGENNVGKSTCDFAPLRFKISLLLHLLDSLSLLVKKAKVMSLPSWGTATGIKVIFP